METVRAPALFESFKSLKDGTCKVSFALNEIPNGELANLLSFHNKFGWLIFASSEAESAFIPNEPPKEFSNDKTPSQRLRACIFVLFEQTKPEGTFDEFYKRKMEQIINYVKAKLDD